MPATQNITGVEIRQVWSWRGRKERGEIGAGAIGVPGTLGSGDLERLLR